MRREGERLRPLGSLAPQSRDAPWSAGDLDRSQVLTQALRERIVSYLRACPVIFAWMGYTGDEIGGQFETAGGSAIASDGTYYWRLDGIDYLRVYGVPVPTDAIQHFEELGWAPPPIDREEGFRIYRELDERLGGGEVVG